MKVLEKILLKLLNGKEIKFQIDSDDDNVPVIKGVINLGEFVDELKKYASK
jgi:hypothetical protein